MSSPLCVNRGTHLYPESTTLITEIEATGVQLKPETHMECSIAMGGGPRVVVSTAAFHARVRGSVPGLGGCKETKNVSPPSTCESQYCGEPP